MKSIGLGWRVEMTTASEEFGPFRALFASGFLAVEKHQERLATILEAAIITGGHHCLALRKSRWSSRTLNPAFPGGHQTSGRAAD